MALTSRLKELLKSALGEPAVRDELVTQMVLQDGSNPAKGTATNDSAAAGVIGEYASASVSVATNVPGATTAWGDLTSVSLTAGDWSVTGTALYTLNGSTATVTQFGISTTTGNSSTGLVAGDNLLTGPAPTATVGTAYSIPTYRISVAATTVVYLKGNCTYSLGNPQYQCRISARRIR